MTKSRIDDSHLRYDSKNKKEKKVWEYFDTVVSTAIVQNTLKKPSVEIERLYHQLSIARLRCEAMKHTPQFVEAKEEQTLIIDGDDHITTNFGRFSFGNTFECEIDSKIWGKVVSDFCLRRLEGRTRNPKSRGLQYVVKSGLSTIADFGMHGSYLLHPGTESIMSYLGDDFQRLLETDNFFDYLKIASKLMFELSNYPPIVRGSAAVNSWLFDKIAKEHFQINCSIRPLLYDWAAFFETAQQYQSFYVISATIQWLKGNLPADRVNTSLYESVADILLENPNLPGVLEKREAVWKKIKAHISDIIENKDQHLNERQLRTLQELLAGEMTFPYPNQFVSD